MSFINKYLRNFTPYRVASHKVWTVEGDERNSILKLDWNEATIEPSPNVDARIKQLVNEGHFYNLYPAAMNEELLQMLSHYIQLPIENIQYFASSDSLHEYIAKLYITVGDPVLLLGPTYDNFRLTAEVCGADIYYYNLDDSFCFDADGFIQRINEVEPSLVYICNPNNPTGTQHEVGFIQKLLEIYPQVLFLVDEAYAEFSGISCKELTLRYENILISRTMSKAFALANFRFGYLLASKKNIEYISSIRNPKNITTFAQEAVIGGLGDIPYMRNYVEEVNRAKQQFITSLEKHHEVKCVYGEGNFVLLCFNDERYKFKLVTYMADHNIFIRAVSQTEYLKRYCVRITVGTCEQMKKVSSVIEGFFMEMNYGADSSF